MATTPDPKTVVPPGPAPPETAREPSPHIAPFVPAAGGLVGAESLLLLQRSAGNRAVNRQLQRQHAPAAPQAQPAAPGQLADNPDPQQTADDYQAAAMDYFEQNMRMELRTAASVEGAAIGRRAGVTAGEQVRAVCEPFERDQEIDANILNTVASITGGGQAIAEGFSSGPRAGEPATGGSNANIASRAVRAAMGILNVWLPTLAGHRTVGSLKDAAVRQATEAGAQGGETTSGSFTEYEDEIMTELSRQWDEDVSRSHALIIRDRIPQGVVDFQLSMISTKRNEYLNRLRNDFGARSPVGAATVSAITAAMAPRMETLRQHLEDAQTSRQRTQALAAIGGGIAGGAAIGAGIGAFAGPAALPSAVIGGAVGAVLGIGAAIAILW